MGVTNDVVAVLKSVLNVNGSVRMTADTPLLGHLPELDSMAVVAVITGLEERFGFTIGDDEIDASVFETVGTLTRFVESKLSA